MCSCCKCLFCYISSFPRPITFLFVSQLYNIMINSFPSPALLIHEPFNVLSFIYFSSTDPIHFIFVLPDRLYPIAFNSDSSMIPRYQQFWCLAHSDTNTWHLFFTSLLLSFLFPSTMCSFIPKLKPCVALSSLFVVHQASSVFSFKNSKRKRHFSLTNFLGTSEADKIVTLFKKQYVNLKVFGSAPRRLSRSIFGQSTKAR